MLENAGENLCHQIQPYNTLNNAIPYSICYVYKFMNRSKKEYVDHIDYKRIYTSSEYTTKNDFYKTCKTSLQST